MRIAQALAHRRDVMQGVDPETKLYWVLTTKDDGSGSENLFTDAAHMKPAGMFSWPMPQWHNGVVDSYPAVLTITFSVTAGEFAGTSGTLMVTLNNAQGTNSLIHLVLKNAHKEECEGDYRITESSNPTGTDITGNETVTIADGTKYMENDRTLPDGTIQCMMLYPDGDRELLSSNPDGTISETYRDTGGQIDATGSLNSDGMDSIQLSDGSTDTVNVDTETTSDESGDDNSGDNSGDSSRKARARRR
jgi:hypothetical protein